jgi:predicted transcriptional regulator YheO
MLQRLDAKKAAMAQGLYNERKHTVEEICQTLGISRATFYRYVKTGERE